MTERIERLVAEVAVCPSFHIIIFIVNQLAVRSIERKRELSGRVAVSIKYIGYGRTSFLTGVPCLKDGIAVARLLRQSHPLPEKLTKTTFFPASRRALTSCL